jgi:hypothetical protein
MRDLPYAVLCTLIGLGLGWLPMFLHGPIPEKFDRFYINGSIAVWGFYLARLSIGYWVGVTTWPPRWYLRGPLCGALALLPLTMISLATPTCGAPCMFWNLVTASLIGTTIAGLAFWATGRHHA